MNVEVREVVLPGGEQVLHVEMTQQFIDIIRKHFELRDDQILEDDHVRMYVWGVVNNAVSKVETPRAYINDTT